MISIFFVVPDQIYLLFLILQIVNCYICNTFIDLKKKTNTQNKDKYEYY
jgi:hypothetical protein